MKLFRRSDKPPPLEQIASVFSRRFREYGETPRGVLWRTLEGQQLRFEILAGILDNIPAGKPLSINDYGCGYGAFFDFLCTLPSFPDMTYTGYDISDDMVRAASARTNDQRATFTNASVVDQAVDFTFVSGTFNLKLQTPVKSWEAYIKSALSALWLKTDKGLAFNMLDNDHAEKGDSLYYADAEAFMNFCSTLSDNVTLIDNAPFQEWTIFIRR